MPAAIDCMARAFAELSAGRAAMPQRTQLPAADGTTLVMSAHLPQPATTCVKVVSVYNGNAARGLPAIMGLVLVLDGETGRPRAVMDGQELTSIRSGAAGGLAAKLLARDDARTVALFGAGHQARAQLAGVRAVHPIEQVIIVGRSRESAERFAAELAGEIRVEVLDDSAAAVRAADIVITATSSSDPVFNGRDLQPGVHITAIGAYKPTMRELDSAAVGRSRIFVDHRAAALAEAGDLISVGVTDFIEIGEVVNGTQPGRQNRDQITLFKSVGVAVQDAAAAQAVVDAAEMLGIGNAIEL